ncbi:Bro-N domain-containing protein [Kitasatospora sp. NPDC002040]|uniref:BRO-N domain-containing protein n=1 Tax=Kitasatospora sp. NPDC002040 TaxID=3154661 RepID=UPI00331FD772
MHPNTKEGRHARQHRTEHGAGPLQWFVTADVCRILGLGNPTKAGRVIDPEHRRTVRLTLIRIQGNRESAGQKAYERGYPIVNVVSEAGLYKLILRSDKAAAKPFQEWVTAELLPSVRRGDTDVPRQQQRMAETLSEAIGQQVQILAQLHQEDGSSLSARSDGTVHCRHGAMELRVPSRQEDSGPPFGPYFECTAVERVGIRGGRAVPGCEKVKLVDLIRRLVARPPASVPVIGGGTAGFRATVHGEVRPFRFRTGVAEFNELLRDNGLLP